MIFSNARIRLTFMKRLDDEGLRLCGGAVLGDFAQAPRVNHFIWLSVLPLHVKGDRANFPAKPIP